MIARNALPNDFEVFFLIRTYLYKKFKITVLCHIVVEIKFFKKWIYHLTSLIWRRCKKHSSLQGKYIGADVSGLAWRRLQRLRPIRGCYPQRTGRFGHNKRAQNALSQSGIQARGVMIRYNWQKHLANLQGVFCANVRISEFKNIRHNPWKYIDDIAKLGYNIDVRKWCWWAIRES